MEQKRRVVVVGGGLAGLSAARALSSHLTVFEVLVVEAASCLGGRVKHIEGLAPWPVQVGPEFLHGKMYSSIKQIADEIGCNQRELAFPDYYYIGSESKLIKHENALENPDIQCMHEIFSVLAEEVPPSPDVSMKDYMLSRGITPLGLQLAQSVYGNDFGCSLENLGVRECIQEARCWTYGDTYLLLDRPISCVVDHLANGLNVILNSPVELVDYSGRHCVLKLKDGHDIMADYVILTVSVKILQQKLIEFVPPLPIEKESAFNAIGMSNAVKVILSFSHRFWPEDMFDVVCIDTFLPELWTTEYPIEERKDTQVSPLGQHVLVGFMTGDFATTVSLLPPKEILLRSLCQIDSMFGKNGLVQPERDLATFPQTNFHRTAQHDHESLGKVDSTNLLQTHFTRDCLFRSESFKPQDCANYPASFYFKGGCMISWADEFYIRGGYSHPSINAHGARNVLAKPVLGKLFFAGEATHPGVNPCMQAAIDTGVRAANEIITLEIKLQNYPKL